MQLPVIELVYQDDSGSTGQVEMRLPAGTTYSVADVAAQAIASAFASITGAVLVRQRIRYRANASSRAAALTGSRNKRAGIFILENVDGLSQLLVQVPGILDSVILSTGNGAGVSIDTDNSDVSSFLSALTDNGVTSPFAVVCANLVAAYVQSRN